MPIPPKTAIIGYGGHAYVVCDILLLMQQHLAGYCEAKQKLANPYALPYLGNEQDLAVLAQLKAAQYNYFIAIGNNHLRQKIYQSLVPHLLEPCLAIHPRACLSGRAMVGKGTMLGAGTIVNACARIGKGVICNTNAIIEHECEINDFAHIAPGAVLCGNVSVGEKSFIGANAVIKQGVRIGSNVLVGAGAVIIHNIPDGKRVVGNPQRYI